MSHKSAGTTRSRPLRSTPPGTTKPIRMRRLSWHARSAFSDQRRARWLAGKSDDRGSAARSAGFDGLEHLLQVLEPIRAIGPEHVNLVQHDLQRDAEHLQALDVECRMLFAGRVAQADAEREERLRNRRVFLAQRVQSCFITGTVGALVLQ